MRYMSNSAHNKLYVLENYFPTKIICRLSLILCTLPQCLNIIIPLSYFYLCLFTTEFKKDVRHLKELCRVKWDKSLYLLSQMSWRLSFSNKSKPLIMIIELLMKQKGPLPNCLSWITK